MKSVASFMIILLLLALSGCEKEQKRTSPKPVQEQSSSSIKKPENKFILEDINTTKITIKIEQNRITLEPAKDITILFFFTSWCPSCKAQIPELKALKKKFEDVEIVGILLNEPQDVQDFLQRYGIDFFVATSYKTNSIVAEKIYRFIKAPASMPVPAIVVLHKNSYFRHYLGAVPLAILQADIKALKEE